MNTQHHLVRLAAMPPSSATAGNTSQNSGSSAGRPAIEFRETVNKENQIRILRNAHRQIYNLIKLDRYGEAEYRSRVLSGILRTWDMKQERSRCIT